MGPATGYGYGYGLAQWFGLVLPQEAEANGESRTSSAPSTRTDTRGSSSQPELAWDSQLSAEDSELNAQMIRFVSRGTPVFVCGVASEVFLTSRSLSRYMSTFSFFSSFVHSAKRRLFFLKIEGSRWHMHIFDVSRCSLFREQLQLFVFCVFCVLNLFDRICLIEDVSERLTLSVQDFCSSSCSFLCCPCASRSPKPSRFQIQDDERSDLFRFFRESFEHVRAKKKEWHMQMSDVSRCSFFVEQLQLSVCVLFVFSICLVEDVSERAVICLFVCLFCLCASRSPNPSFVMRRLRVCEMAIFLSMVMISARVQEEAFPDWKIETKLIYFNILLRYCPISGAKLRHDFDGNAFAWSWQLVVLF